jgi:ring-1,2-phenylacetyl-CoA epoxidase subunit PaaE
MRNFHELTVEQIVEETPDAVRIRLSVPAELAADYAFRPGQHIPVEAEINGERVRRTYSLCSTPDDAALEIGIRVQPGGRFSNWAARELRAGDVLRVMPPAGRFFTEVRPGARRHVLAVAAGSGITPVLSIIRSVLEHEPDSRATLFYGNRTQRSTMFIEDLYALKNRFPERLSLQFLFSREEQEFPIASGRLDDEKTCALFAAFCANDKPDDVFVCGPDTVIPQVTEALVRCGVTEAHIHSERFGVPRAAPGHAAAEHDTGTGGDVNVTVVMDGHRRRFTMHRDDDNIVDAAAAAAVELPYSCKGGVCATCRTWVEKGSVDMAVNYGLEPWEVDKGFILACQSRPTSDELTLDYDRT